MDSLWTALAALPAALAVGVAALLVLLAMALGALLLRAAVRAAKKKPPAV